MERNTLENMIENGLNLSQIAVKLSKSYSTIARWAHKYQLGPKRTMICNSCGEKDEAKFTHGRYNRCKRCRSKYQISLFKRYKIKAAKYKGGKCIQCGYNKCLASLDFHHLDPSQKDPKWKNMHHWSFDKIKEELDKCILVCKNCHGEIHHGLDNIDEAYERISSPKVEVIKPKKICIDCGIVISKKPNKCIKCYKRQRSLTINFNPTSIKPSKEELEKQLWELPTSQLCKLYNVSDVAIAKWAKNYNICKPPRGYWTKKKYNVKD